ncbi:MAG: glycosyltransferase family 9 protein, partial [Arenimonas sp.]
VPVIDLVGKDTLKQLLALLERADLLLSPDSGPLHMANTVGTKVIGLYACTDAERSGPYSDRRYTVNHYQQAALQFMNKPADQLPWGKRVEFPGVMDLIKVEEVIACFDRYCEDNKN